MGGWVPGGKLFESTASSLHPDGNRRVAFVSTGRTRRPALPRPAGDGCPGLRKHVCTKVIQGQESLEPVLSPPGWKPKGESPPGGNRMAAFVWTARTRRPAPNSRNSLGQWPVVCPGGRGVHASILSCFSVCCGFSSCCWSVCSVASRPQHYQK